MERPLSLIHIYNFASGKTAIAIDGPWLIGSLSEIQDKIGIAKAPTFGDGKVAENYLVTDAQTPWAAAKTDDPEKEEAIVAFMKYITSEESVKQLTLEGAVFLSPKLNMEDPDVKMCIRDRHKGLLEVSMGQVSRLSQSMHCPAGKGAWRGMVQLVRCFYVEEFSLQF